MENPRVIINHQRITDAPYGSGQNNIFSFRDDDVRNFASELIYGNQTCYLVSGYRGAGKTSFINRVEEYTQELNKNAEFKTDKRNNIASDSYKLIFVKASFAKYSNQTAFLRQLIRNLYICINAQFDDHTKSSLNNSILDDFKKLFTRTFYDIRSRQDASEENIITSEITFDIKADKALQILFTAVTICAPLSIAPLIANTISTNPIWFGLGALSLSSALAVLGYFNIKRSFKKTTATKTSTAEIEIYDDEIAFYHFETTLFKLKKEAFKIVFVLDELDKVSDTEIERLINEMKPYLLSGMADFIVVAGQKLTHKYIAAQQADDAVISSLFSKIVHVPLKGVQDLRNIIYEKLIQNESHLSDEQKAKLLKYINATIYEAKRVPRTVFSKIRQALEWTGDEASLEFTRHKSCDECSDILDIIEDQIKKSIEPLSLNPAMKDYVIAQLYRVASTIQYVKGDSLNVSTVFKQFEESKESYDLYYFVILKRQIAYLLVPLGKQLNIRIDFDRVVEENTTSNENQSQVTKERERREKEEVMRSFQNDISRFSAIARKIYALSGSSMSSTTTTWEILGDLAKIGPMRIGLPKNDFIQKVLNNPDVLQDPSVLEDSFAKCQKEGIDFNALSFNLLEEYVELTTNKTLLNTATSDFADNTMAKQAGADFLILNKETPKSPHVLICVKYFTGQFNLNVSELVPILIRENNRTKKGNYFVLAIFTFDNKNTFDTQKYKLEAELERVNKWLIGRIHFIINSINDLEQFQTELEAFKKHRLQPYLAVIDYSIGREIVRKDDLQKSRWGGAAFRAGLEIGCSNFEKKGEMYLLTLFVKHKNSKEFNGLVIFFLHDSFDPIINPVSVQDGVAELKIEASQAFTVGAVVNGEIELELDLNEVPNAPEGFRYPKNRI